MTARVIEFPVPPGSPMDLTIAQWEADRAAKEASKRVRPSHAIVKCRVGAVRDIMQAAWQARVAVSKLEDMLCALINRTE